MPAPIANTRRRGTVAVLVATSLVLMMGATALVLDGGLILADRRRAQAAADAAALAASYSLYSNQASENGLDPNHKARDAARAMASANGFAHDGASTVVTVNVPPTTGPFVGQAGYAEVVVAFKRPRIFSALWGRGTMGVTGRAVARATLGPYSPASIILLDPSASASLSAAGSARVVAATGIQVNSSSPSAAKATNSGSVTAPTINIVGGYSTDASGKFFGALRTGAAGVADPLAGLPTPDPSTMSQGGLSDPNSLPAYQRPPAGQYVPGYGTYTIKGGVYNGGLHLAGGATVTMQPGIYYMKGGDFIVDNGVSVSGEGVMIYTENGYSISIQGGGVIKFSPPTSGTYAGMMFYQDRSSSKTMSIANGSTTVIKGTVYAANAQINFAGGAQYGQGGVANQGASQFIAKQLNVSNNAYVSIGYNASDVARRKALNLVE
jgi:Flp pilus assembly protein TadG